MKTISLKMGDSIMHKMDEYMKLHNFSTRTEFVREAIRDKLTELEGKHFEQEMRRFFRENKGKIGKEFTDINHDVFAELEKRFG